MEGYTGKSNLFSGLIASFIKKGHARKPYLGRGEDERFASSTLTTPALIKSGSDYDEAQSTLKMRALEYQGSEGKAEEGRKEALEMKTFSTATKVLAIVITRDPLCHQNRRQPLARLLS